MSRIDMPVIGKLYPIDSDDVVTTYQLGQEWLHSGITYRFCKIAISQVLRKGASCYFNADHTVNQVSGISNCVNCWSPATLDTMGAEGYALMITSGNNVLVNKEGADTAATANVFENSRLVPWTNGNMKCANAVYNACVNRLQSDVLTCVALFTLPVEANLAARVSVGDYWNTDTGYYGTVAKLVNGSSFITSMKSTPAITNDTSHVVQIYSNMGALGKAKATVTCANGVAYQILGYGGSDGAITNSNTAWMSTKASGAVVYLNSAVAGYLFKVGDTIVFANQTGYSTLAISSINNTKAFTTNANVTVDLVGQFGVIANANAYCFKAIVG